MIVRGESSEAAGLRKRELLLSLRNSTVESCFSVPMLNLTMPNLPFLLAYATAALQWRPWAIGLIAALPHISNFLQPPISRFLEKRYSLLAIMRGAFVGSAAPWFFVLPATYFPEIHHTAFAIILCIATLANSVASVAWSASIAEVVPERISGAYFGRRNLAFGAWTLITVLSAGKLVDANENSLIVFALIFAAAGTARLLGLFFLNKMTFPKSVIERRTSTYRVSDLLSPLLDSNYRNYMLFIAGWGFFLNLGAPFYTVYLLRHLHVNVGHTLVLATLSTLGGILTLKSWGMLSDRFGSKPVQYVTAYAWCLVGVLGWAIVSPGREAHLFLAYTFVGGATAGFQLTQFNLMLKLIPRGKGSSYIAVFVAVTSAFTCLGPLAGGALLATLPTDFGVILGQTITKFHCLFLASFVGMLLCLPFLTSTREPSAEAIHHVWRSMVRMRSFNPLLAVTNAASFLFTPRGILSLGTHSFRSLRRQLRNVVEVGTEIVEGGQSILKERQ